VIAEALGGVVTASWRGTTSRWSRCRRRSWRRERRSSRPPGRPPWSA